MFFDFVARRKIWYIITLLIIIPGLFSLMLQGLNLGIDFVGGTKIMLKFSENITTEELRQALAEHNLEGSSIQESEANQFIIRTSVLSEGESNQLLATIQEKLGSMEVLDNELVGSVVSSELKSKTILALLIAIVLMIIYITVRFEFSSAVAAIIGLIGDVLVTLSIFSILQLEVDLTFVAAFLTIIGYSINNSIIVFDRIRENQNLKEKETVSELVNKSISQTLTRSINTSLTSIATLIALIILGGETTRLFALAMAIGFTHGTYSSIFLVSPLWVDLQKYWFNKGGNKKPRAATSR